MKTLNVDQGTLEWAMGRLGIPTASCFDKLLTPQTRKPSTSRDPYRAELVAEWLMGQPLDWGTNAWMERGTELEDEARRWYEMDRGVDVEQVGLVLRDDGLVGGSPDGLVGADGGLEIKCPAAVQHVKYLLGIDDLATAHTGQVQGYMYLTGRASWDVLSYNPALPAVVVRVARDEDYQAALVAVLEPFIEQVEADKAKWAEYRVPRPWQEEQAIPSLSDTPDFKDYDDWARGEEE
ncbi:MAG TPA: YqaJ viral recombinase family protein [Phycisphaerae bacterium]|nr:YqaJ viral recombinase family protein [Phycisphaerae bacterium]